MSTDPELSRLREQMDDVNQQLVHVLHERARLSRCIGSHKQSEGLSVVDAVREQAMLKALLRDLPSNGFPEAALVTILGSVFVASRQLVASPQH